MDAETIKEISVTVKGKIEKGFKNGFLPEDERIADIAIDAAILVIQEYLRREGK